MTLRHVYIALVAYAVMCGTSLAYQEPSACLDADGEDMGVQCVYVDVGLTCPKNFYCPTYTVGEAITYATMLSDNNCTVSSSAVVQCPCPPGFYCPANMGQPTYCPAGYYCPADSSAIATATSAGLGAWGSVAKICPEGNFCALGQVEPLECSVVGMCEEVWQAALIVHLCKNSPRDKLPNNSSFPNPTTTPTRHSPSTTDCRVQRRSTEESCTSWPDCFSSFCTAAHLCTSLERRMQGS